MTYLWELVIASSQLWSDAHLQLLREVHLGVQVVEDQLVQVVEIPALVQDVLHPRKRRAPSSEFCGLHGTGPHDKSTDSWPQPTSTDSRVLTWTDEQSSFFRREPAKNLQSMDDFPLPGSPLPKGNPLCWPRRVIEETIGM